MSKIKTILKDTIADVFAVSLIPLVFLGWVAGLCFEALSVSFNRGRHFFD